MVIKSWWTGEDSNLRSPQGAADLQSAGFSHSPTRPAESFGTQAPASRKSFGTQLHCPALPTRTLPDRCTGHSAMQKGLVSEDTNPSAFVARNSVRNLAKNFRRAFKVSWRRELNPRPSDYKSDALPTELRQRCSNPTKLSQRQSDCKQVSVAPANLLPSQQLQYVQNRPFALLSSRLRKLPVRQVHVVMNLGKSNRVLRLRARLVHAIR